MILTSPLILTFRNRIGPVGNGAIAIHRGTIVAVGPRETVIRKYSRHHIYSLPGTVLMPGLINAHAHIELPPLLNRIRANNYSQWVLNLLRTKRHLTRADYTAAAQVNIESLIASGTTTVADICTHGASPSVLGRSGLRAIIYRELISMDRETRLPTVPRISRPASPLIRYGLSPHSPHTISEPVLRAIQKTALKSDMSLCMHVAETREELRFLRGTASGLDDLYATAGWDRAWAPRARSSFEYLRRIGILGPRFLAVHAVHADDADIAIIRRSGAGIAHCPRSNRAIGVGKMSLAKFLDAGIPVGLGTDSLASTSSLNLWDEMRYARRIHRSSGITPSDILHLATIGGARALGMDQDIGSLEPGKRADLIAVPLPKKDTGDLASDLLRETKTCIMSMVNGNIIYPLSGAKRK